MQKSHRSLIEYVITNGRDKMSWYEIGKAFGIQSPNKKRAKLDQKYKRKSIATKAQDIWIAYLERKNKLELTKEVYIDGSLKSETFTKTHDKVEPEIDYDNYEIERFTTNPNGVPWYKFKRKEVMYDEEHYNELLDKLKTVIEPISIELPETNNGKSLLIYGSDKHIGALTKESSIYTNKYDVEEMRKRIVYNTLKEIETWVKLFGSFRKLFIMDLGDALDGFNQKTTGGLRGTSSHTLPQQLNNREQHDLYVELHKELFDILTMRGYAQEIFFVATSNSNHGGDFEYGAMRNLETYLNVKYPEINTCVNYYPLNHFQVSENHIVIFGHGKDDEDMKRGLPLVLNDKVENYIADYIRNNQLEGYTITFVTGDLHQAAKTHGKNFRYKKVLSQYGSSKWMHTNFGKGQAGLSSEVFINDTNQIYETDTFFEKTEVINTGIYFNK